MKTVSVIIPFYNHLDWLYEAIDSVLLKLIQFMKLYWSMMVRKKI